MRAVPSSIDGEPVQQMGDPLTFNGEEWVTLVSTDMDDGRVWEFSLTSGRLLLTVEG